MTTGNSTGWLVGNGLGRGSIGGGRRIVPDDGTVSGSTLSISTPPHNCDIEPELPPMKDVQVVIAHVNTLNDFYVIRKSDLESLDKLNMDLSSVLSFGALDLYRHDDKNRRRSVAVYSYAPQKWKRLVYLAPAGVGNCKARLIDHGDIDVLAISELRLLPALFEKVAPFAIHCSMDIVPARGEVAWAEDIISTLRNELDGRNAPSSEQLDGGGLHARCLRKENGVNVVILHALGGEDWGSILVDAGFAQRATFDTVTKSIESFPELDTPGAGGTIAPIFDQITVSSQNEHDFSAVVLGPEQNIIVQKLLNVHLEDLSELEATKPKPLNRTPTSETRAYPFTSEKLTPAPPLPTTGSSKNKYTIIHAFDMNHFYIKPKSSAAAESCVELWDELNSYMLSGTATKLEHSPGIGDLVVAADPSPGKKANPYFRGVVTRALCGTRYEVRNVDNGKSIVVNENAMHALTRDILSLPVLGYEVILDGVRKEPELILQSDFNSCIRGLRKTNFQLELKCLGSSGIPVVSLKALSDSRLLSERINDLAKWPWEAILGLHYYRSDNEIIEKGGHVSPVMPLLDLPMNTEFTIIVKTVVCSDDDLEPFITFEAVLPEIQRLRNVLFNQCERYLQNVSASPHYPSNGEVVFLVPPPGEIGAGHLQRAVRVSANCGLYYCFDTGVTYRTDQRQDYVIRKMVIDFTRIPHLLVDGALCGFVDNPSSRRTFQETFQVGREVHILIKEVADETIFKFECLEYETK